MAAKRRKKAGKAESHQKGRVLEDVVAMLHAGSDVTVQTRARLPTIAGRRSRRRYRTIDVLLTGHLAGYPVHVAIECKNYGEPIGIDLIGKFRDMLEDVGIPLKYGIYVSVHGYTRDALERAEELGIRTLALSGLTPDRLAAEVRQAMQSMIYLLLDVENITIESGLPYSENLALYMLIDRTGEECGSLPDLIWLAWRNGEIPLAIGTYQIQIDPPLGWYWRAEGLTMPNRATARVKVAGLLIDIPGSAEIFQLSDAETGAFERVRVRASFDTERRSYPVQVAESEEELASRLSASASTRLTLGRVPLPRIRYNMLFWPPSDRTNIRLAHHAHLLIRQGRELTDLSTLSLLDIEGSDLSAIWLPISDSHPVASNPDWPLLPPVD